MATSKTSTKEPVNRSITVNGIKLNYFDWEGPGPSIVMLHGTTSYGRSWDFTARPLSSAFRILALDQRGHGDSDKPPAGYAGEDYVADLAGFIDALGITPCILVGKSLGGRVAITYGGLYPNKVSHIVLVNGPHFVSLFSDIEASERLINEAEAMRKSKETFPSEEEAIKQLSGRYADRGGEVMLKHALRYNTIRRPNGSLEWKFNEYAAAETLRHIPDNLTSYVLRITCPVLFAVAERNRDMAGERLHRAESLFAKVVSVQIPDSSRDPQWENPNELAKVIRHFLITQR